jgi:hypothetical protein
LAKVWAWPETTIQYPGAIYHVMSRGDRRAAILADDADRQRYLATLTETCQKTGWQVRADLAWLLGQQRKTKPLQSSDQKMLEI